MIPYQYALRRRMMQPIERNVELSISGSFHTINSYVLVDGVQYKTTTTLSLPKGTEVSVTVYSFAGARFYLNNVSVAGTSSGSVNTYTFVLTADAAIVVDNSNTFSATAHITIPA